MPQSARLSEGVRLLFGQCWFGGCNFISGASLITRDVFQWHYSVEIWSAADPEQRMCSVLNAYPRQMWAGPIGNGHRGAIL